MRIRAHRQQAACAAAGPAPKRVKISQLKLGLGLWYVTRIKFKPSLSVAKQWCSASCERLHFS